MAKGRQTVNDQSEAVDRLDLAKPMAIRAEMARKGLIHLMPYDDPERGWVDPLNNQETKAAVRAFMGRLWRACQDAEGR